MPADSEDEESLQSVIAYYKAGLASGSLQPREVLAYWWNLSNALSELAEEECDPELAKEAIEAGGEAFKRLDPTDDAWLGLCSDLSASYLTGFELTGVKTYLQHAITVIRVAVKATAIGDAKRCARLANLCNTLCSAFEAYGERDYIDEAVTMGRKVLDDEHADANDHARAMSNLGRALGLRYNTFQVYSDILTAIDITRRAVSTAKDPSVEIQCKSNLVGHLISVAERDRTDETVDSALELGRSIYNKLEGADRALCAHNMSYLHRLRYERVSDTSVVQAGDVADLQSAVTLATEAINAYPGDDVKLSMYEDQLVLCLNHAYQASPADSDKLSLAIHLAEKAISRTEENDPRRATYINHLVDLLKERQQADDLRRAVSLSESVMDMESADLVARIAAGQATGNTYYQLGEISKAFEAFQRTVSLIPVVAYNALARSDQQYVLGQCVGLSSMAASIALDDGRPATTAFKVLEDGRGILTALAIRSRGGLPPELESCHGVKDLLERYNEIKRVLGHSQQHTASLYTGTHLNEDVLVTVRAQLQSELLVVEQQLYENAQYNFGSVVEAFDPADILGSDFVVSLNITAIRSDAFIMTKDGVDSIKMPMLEVQELAKHVRQLMGVDRITQIRLDTWRENNEKLRAMLLWLWECAVEPILSHLTLLSQSAKASALPRICWLASGPLGLMPFHAAGDHSDDSTSFTMAHVVSSYVVSTQALQWCRREMALRTQNMEQIKPKALIISMPETPDQPDLDCAEEIAMFHKAFPHVKDMVQPTASLTCEALSTAATVHFACHAESDPEDPSNSSLILLSDKGKTADRLSIYKIAETNSPNALLAVLSACQTADQQNLDHVDETIHLAGAFQIAVFPQVVGSLWEAESDYASNMTVDFYARFAMLGGYSAGRDTGARAMHDAMVQLRSEDPEAVLSWAPFVIYGA